MKILINDSRDNKERLINIFCNGGYERNNLIFVHSFEECKMFFENQLEKGVELDLIITGKDTDSSINSLNPHALLLLKNSIDKSFSRSNFRINSIPIILYSSADDKSELQDLGFNAIVKSNDKNKHSYMIKVVEQQIRKWREQLIIDLHSIGLSEKYYPYFKNEYEEKRYFNSIGRHFEQIFFNRTSVLSKEFIANPSFLSYDWLRIKDESLEQSLIGFSKMYKYHIKYDRKNNERTIIHNYLLKNVQILERDSYSDHLYEVPLMEKNGVNSQICDFILRPSLPSYQDTTFFEVKKEDVQLMVKKNKKRPQPSHEMHAHLYQLSDYQSYSANVENAQELSIKLGYITNNFTYQLLAGRLEEKEEVNEVFNSILAKNFSGIEVFTFEEFEQLGQKYIDKLSRLKI